MTLFVIMWFGVRAVGTPPEPLDFDQVYLSVLRPLAEQAGWDVLRIDDLVEPGVITTQAFRELFAADLVVADVTSTNRNVYYELGIRQALSPSGRAIIALAGTRLPFDIANQRVLFYQRNLTADQSFAGRYVKALNAEAAHGPTASPVRQALEQLGLVVPISWSPGDTLNISSSRTPICAANSASHLNDRTNGFGLGR